MASTTLNVLPFPICAPGPTWILTDADNPLGLPVMGQFDPQGQDDPGQPIWQKKPSIAGGLGWLKYVGENLGSFSFEFLAISNSVLDQYPTVAWERLQTLYKVDESLGRPPRVIFNHGPIVVEGFITSIPAAPIEYWGGNNAIRSRLIRQVGPVRITITKIPKETSEISLFTNFVTKTEETNFEDLSLLQYGDARYAQTLAIHNQGIKLEETVEIPRKRSGQVSKVTPVAPQLDEVIAGL